MGGVCAVGERHSQEQECVSVCGNQYQILCLTDEGEIRKAGSPPRSSCGWHTISSSVRLWLVVIGGESEDHIHRARILLFSLWFRFMWSLLVLRAALHCSL